MKSSKINNVATALKLHTFKHNKNFKKMRFPNLEESLNSRNMQTAYDVISKWPKYEPTKLYSLNRVADFCGVRSVLYKDESTRFGLGSFKALGGSYAIANLIEDYKTKGKLPSEITIATATDGNHGRSVSWGAKLAGCNAKIFIHAEVSVEREKAMSELGADVIRINGNYEASLAACKDQAKLNNWLIVSDTSWAGYRKIPMEIMAGYSVMSKEILDQMGSSKPSHTFLPIGVGGLAAGVVAPIWNAMNTDLGQIISVESHFSQCFLDSIVHGKPTTVDIKEETLMAGLSCGEVSEIAWEILKPTISHCMSIGDEGIPLLMKYFSKGEFGDECIEAGECATSGIAALLIAKQNQDIWKRLNFDHQSDVLLIGTEGATDPDLYNKLITESE
ncbi:MAG: diaminopropionate ammonia-lyase [Paracoccaceae bacterium]|nr:diaminopropionate ammonia-lyase [Paracoccaceae bacterium]